jgi:lipopolysaccharide biosynthesis regulator YciM
MSKKLCEDPKKLKVEEKNPKYECKKCGKKTHKEKWCCKPVKI